MISSTNTLKIQTQIQELYMYIIKSPYKNTSPLEPLEYCKTIATFHTTQERAIRVNNILKLLDIFQSTVLNKVISIRKTRNGSKQITEFSKTVQFCKSQNLQDEQQQLLTMFKFQNFLVNQQEFEQFF